MLNFRINESISDTKYINHFRKIAKIMIITKVSQNFLFLTAAEIKIIHSNLMNST